MTSGSTEVHILLLLYYYYACRIPRLANRLGMAGIVPELIHSVQCPRRGSFCPGNVKNDHWAGYMAVH